MTDLLDKQYVVTMPDGSKWAVPVRVIAESRADYYAHEYDGDLDRSLKEDTIPLFETSEADIEDWARNNMDWSDVQHEARLVQTPEEETDYQDGWANGEVEVIDG